MAGKLVNNSRQLLRHMSLFRLAGKSLMATILLYEQLSTHRPSGRPETDVSSFMEQSKILRLGGQLFIFFMWLFRHISVLRPSGKVMSTYSLLEQFSRRRPFISLILLLEQSRSRRPAGKFPRTSSPQLLIFIRVRLLGCMASIVGI